MAIPAPAKAMAEPRLTDLGPGRNRVKAGMLHIHPSKTVPPTAIAVHAATEDMSATSSNATGFIASDRDAIRGDGFTDYGSPPWALFVLMVEVGT